MSIIELTKVFSHLQVKCTTKGLHNTFLVTDCKYLEVKIWCEYKNTPKTLLDRSVSIQNRESLRGLLLEINAAVENKNKSFH